MIIVAIGWICCAAGTLGIGDPSWLVGLFLIAFVFTMIKAISQAPGLRSEDPALRSISTDDDLARLRRLNPAPYRRGEAS